VWHARGVGRRLHGQRRRRQVHGVGRPEEFRAARDAASVRQLRNLPSPVSRRRSPRASAMFDLARFMGRAEWFAGGLPGDASTYPPPGRGAEFATRTRPERPTTAPGRPQQRAGASGVLEGAPCANEIHAAGPQDCDHSAGGNPTGVLPAEPGKLASYNACGTCHRPRLMSLKGRPGAVPSTPPFHAPRWSRDTPVGVCPVGLHPSG